MTPLWFRPFMILWKTWFFLLFLLALVITYPVFLYLLAKERRFPAALRLMRTAAWCVHTFSGVFPVVEGRENFPKPPYIIVPNHSSYMDILLMYSVVPDYFIFMGKAELESWPLFKIFFTKGMNIPVNRESIRHGHQAYQRAYQDIDKGHSIVIFPEATIPTHVPKMKKFKNGAFRLAIEKQVPLVPITFTCNYKRLMNGGFMKAMAGPGLAPAIIHKPIRTVGLTQEDLISLRDQTFEVIESSLPEHED